MINVQPEAQFYISGDLASYDSAGRLYALPRIRNTGTIILEGDLVNNTQSNMFLDEGIPGPILFTGNRNQYIRSDSSSVAIYLPSIFKDDQGGASLFILLDTIRVDSTIRFNAATSGNIVVGNSSVILEANGIITGERSTSRLILDSGSVRIEFPTLSGMFAPIYHNNYPGNLDSALYLPPSELYKENIFGLGWGITNINEAARGKDGGSGVRIARKGLYKPSGKQSQVANGMYIERLYEMTFHAPDVDTLDTLILHYLDADNNGLSNTDQLSLYISEDNGESWIKKSEGVFNLNPGNDSTNTLTLTDVLVRGDVEKPTATNLFVIAESDCETQYMPDNTNAIRSSQQINTSSDTYRIDVCSGDELLLEYKKSHHYTWWIGDSLIIENDAITIDSVTNTHEGLYTLKLRNKKGCEIQRDIQINVWTGPKWDGDVNFFSTNTDLICTGEPVKFTSAFLSDQGAIASWEWSFGDEKNSASSLESPELSYTKSGKYPVSLTVSTEYGCLGTFRDTISIYPVPESVFKIKDTKGGDEITQICSGESIFLDPASSIFITDLQGNNETPTIQWDFGDGNTLIPTKPSLFNPDFGETSHTYTVSSNQVFTIQLTSETNAGCTHTYTQQIKVIAEPDASFALNDDSGIIYEGCITNEVQFISNASLSDASAFEYLWNFGDGTTSTEPRPLKTYSVAGNYEVVLDIKSKSSGCTSSFKKNYTFNESPIIPFEEAVFSCEGTLELDAKNPGSTYKWTDLSGIVLSNQQKYVVSSTSEDPFSIFLEITSTNGCVKKQETRVQLNTSLNVDLGEDRSACQSMILGGNVFPSASYLWSTGATTPQIEVTESGTYSVTIKDQGSDLKCITSDQVIVTILPLPRVNLGSDIVLCSGEEATIDAGEHTGYQWSTGETSRKIVRGTSGWVWVDVQNELGCTSRDSLFVTAYDDPELNLPNQINFCGENGFTLNAGVDALKYEWGSSTGAFSTNKSIFVSQPGKYWVRVESTSGCIQSDTVEVIRTSDRVKAEFLIPSTVGVGDLVNIVQLTDPLPESSTWSFGDGTFSTQVNPIHQYLRAGEYTITLIADNGGCADTLRKQIQVVEARFISDNEQVKQKVLEIVDIEAYPNPFRDKLNLKIELSDVSQIEIRVFNLAGREVLRAHDKTDLLEKIVDLSNEISGIYYLSIQTENQNQLLKIVKPR